MSAAVAIAFVAGILTAASATAWVDGNRASGAALWMLALGMVVGALVMVRL